MIGHFDKQIGKLLEVLVEHNTVKLFRERGIDNTHTYPNPVSQMKHLSLPKKTASTSSASKTMNIWNLEIPRDLNRNYINLLCSERYKMFY